MNTCKSVETMTLKEAFAYAKGDDYEASKWRLAEKTLVAAGYCPHCAEDGEREKLGRWVEGNASEYSGRSCMACESFYPCGIQPEYGGSDSDGFSDADPGL